MPLPEIDVGIVKAVVHEFLTSKKPTPRKPLLLKAKSTEPLERLARWSVLKTHNHNKYLPTALAFNYCGDADMLLLAKQSVEMVANVLKNLFEISQEDNQFSAADVENHARKMYDVVDPEKIKLGLYLADEFQLGAGRAANPEQTEINFITISEHVVEIDPRTLWDEQIKRGTDWIEGQIAGASGVSPGQPGPDVEIEQQMIVDMQGPTSEKLSAVHGPNAQWERIEPLGKGGQSDVFLVRNPARSAERAKCLDKIRVALDGDKRAELATAIWSYARPDVPSELGALKVFKIPPEGMGLPPPPGSEEFEAIERLKGEIAVLGQGLPGLPKLLGSNLAERWIVTEYFPERTLEHHPLRFQGSVAAALRALQHPLEAGCRVLVRIPEFTGHYDVTGRRLGEVG